jgi:KaiC/GvpD/RAD55 family RecA-like ATPase
MSKHFGVNVRDEELEVKGDDKGLQVRAIPSGISGFDDAIGQGLPSGNMYLIQGSTGSNNILFVQQFLYNLLASKSKVTYYNLEFTSFDIIRDMSIYKMDIAEYVEDGSWKFVRMVLPKMKKIQDVLSQLPTEERIDLEGSLSPLMDHFQEGIKNGRNTAIHLSYLLRNHPLEDVQNLLMFMRELVRKYGGIHFLLLSNETNSPDSISVMKDIVDSVLDISMTIRGTDVESLITIQKIRGVIPKSRQIRLSVRDTGISIETIRRVD